MPILIKGSGGATATSFGYTECYDEKDTEYITLDLGAETITIIPRSAAKRYGLSRISDIDNLCIRIRESGDPYHEIMFAWDVGVSNRWLYTRWEGNATVSKASEYYIDRGSFDASYDNATGVLTITGCEALAELSGDDITFDIRITWEIN